MACSIIKNKSGVQSVLAPNGVESNLYQDLLKLPFIEGQNDALVYHNKAQQYAKDSFFTDGNGEPVLMFRARSAPDQLGLMGNKLVYTTSFAEALAQDKQGKGVEVGFMQKRAKANVLEKSNTPAEFFRNTRNAGLEIGTGEQVLSELAGSKSVVVTTSQNDFKPIALFNRETDASTAAGFATMTMNSGFVKNEKVNLSNLLEAQPASEGSQVVNVETRETGGQPSSINVIVNDNNVANIDLQPMLNGFEVPLLDLSNEAFPETVAHDMLKLAFAKVKKPIYSSRELSEQERNVWETLVQEQVATQMPDGRYVLERISAKKRNSKNQDISIAQLKNNGTIQVKFNSSDPHYVYKGQVYRSQGALNKAVKLDLRRGNVSVTTPNNSFVFELQDPLFEGVIEGFAEEMFGTKDFLTFFEQNGKVYMMMDENHANQIFSDVKTFKNLQGQEMEVDVRKEYEKVKKGGQIQDIPGLSEAVENMLLRDMQDAALEEARSILDISEQDKMRQLTGFLDRLGINLVSLDDYKKSYEQRFGVPLEANGLADMLNKVVVLSNEADLSVLTEEVAHFAIEFFNDQEVLENMLKNIDQTNAYKANAANYRDAYSKKTQGAKGLEGDALERKVRKEVLGKILADKIQDNFDQSSASNSVETGIFSILRDFFNRFLDIFTPNRGNVQFFEEFGQTIDNIARGVVDPNQTGMFTERQSNEFYFSLQADPTMQRLSQSLATSMASYQTKYLRLLGTESEGLSKSNQMNEIVQKALDHQLLESSAQFLGIMRSDVEKAADIFDRAERQVIEDLRQANAGNPQTSANVSPQVKANLILEKIPTPNVMNLITYMSDVTTDLDVIDAFLTDAAASDLFNPNDVVRLQDLSQAIRTQTAQLRPVVDSVIRAQVKSDIIDLARQKGATESMIKDLEAKMLSGAGLKDMTMAASYLFSGSDMISNPILSYGLMAIREEQNNANGMTESYFSDFVQKLRETNMFGREEEFFEKAVNGSYFRSPIDIGAFMKDFNDAKQEIKDKYKEKISKLDTTTDEGNFKRQELLSEQAEELQKVNEKFLMSRYVEKPDNRRRERDTVNPVSGLKTRTQDAQRSIAKFSKAKAEIYSRYRDPDTGEFVNNFSTRDLDALDEIKKQIKLESSLYNAAFRPKTGGELATALDLQDYYESFQGGEMSEAAKDAYYVAREKVKAEYGENSKNFKAWEKVFSIETYAEESVETQAEPVEIDEEALRDASIKYDATIASIRAMINTENIAESDITPSFLYEALKEKRRTILAPYRSAKLNNEVDGTSFSRNELAVAEVRKIDEYLSFLVGPRTKNTPRGEFVMNQERTSPFTFEAVPNQSFKAKFLQLLQLDNETGGSQLQDWLRTLELAPGKSDGVFPIPRDAYYVTFKKYKDGVLVPKEKGPSFVWESMTGESKELNPDFNSDLIGKFHQPSAWAMEKYRDDKYFEYFGIKKSVDPWSDVATRNTDVFDLLTYYQETKYDVDRYQGLNNHYYLRPQVRKIANERLYKGLTDPSTIPGSFKTWAKETFVIDSTDEEFGAARPDGSKQAVRGSRAIPRYFHIEKPQEELTQDVAYSMGRYMDAGFRYIGRSRALMKAQMALFMLEQNVYAETGPGILKRKGTSNYAQTMREMIDRDIFGNLTSGALIGTDVNIGGNQVNAAKTVKALTKYSKGLLMSGNPFVPATSYAASRLMIRAVGREGKLFTEKSRRRARRKYLLDTGKSIFDENTGQFIPGNRATLLIQYAGLKRDVEEMFTGTTLSRGRRAARRFKPGNITGFQIFNQIQSVEAVTAALDNFRLYDGKFLTHAAFVNKLLEETNMTRDQIEKQWDKLSDKTYDNFLTREGERLVLNKEALKKEGFDPKSYQMVEAQAKELAKTAKSKIDANLEGSQAALLSRRPELALFFPFKNYLSVFLGSRLKRGGFDPVTGIYDEGVYNTVFGGTKGKDLFKALGAMALSAANFSAANNSVLSLLDNTDLSEAQKRNWIRMGADVRMFTIAALSAYLLTMLAYQQGADGEEDDSLALNFASYIATRVYYETFSSTFFGTAFTPQEIMGPGAAIGQLTSFLGDTVKILGFDPTAEEDTRSKAEIESDRGIISVLGIESPSEFTGMMGELFDRYVPLYYNLHRAMEYRANPAQIRKTESNYIRYRPSVFGQWLYKSSKEKGKGDEGKAKIGGSAY